MVDAGTKPADILKMALEKEKEAYAYYCRLAEQTDNAAVKTTLLEMAEEEKAHISKLEEEIDSFFQPDN